MQVIASEMKKFDHDAKLKEDILARLLKRQKGRISKEQGRHPSDHYFDVNLSCFNLIKSCNLSMKKWDELRICLRDMHYRGANMLQLPTSRTLYKYRHKLVPHSLKTTASTARISVQNVLDHTAKRLVLCPDMKDFLAKVPDHARLDLLWKWGIDGQTGP